MRAHRGFTLLELMVVVALIALGTAAVVVNLRDSDESRLETEALRLGAVLDAARAQSLTSGVALVWQAGPEGYSLGPAGNAVPTATPAMRNWLHAGTTASIVQPTGSSVLLLGPEPLMPPQRIELRLGDARLALASDGVGPFTVQRDAP